VGCFAEDTQAPPSFVKQVVYVEGEKAVIFYKRFSLPFFITRRTLKKWEEEIDKELTSHFSVVPATFKEEILARWLKLCEECLYAGIGNYLTIEEAVRRSPLVVVYEYEGKKLLLGREAFKPVPDKGAIEYLYPLSCFPETIKKVGVTIGT